MKGEISKSTECITSHFDVYSYSSTKISDMETVRANISGSFKPEQRLHITGELKLLDDIISSDNLESK